MNKTKYSVSILLSFIVMTSILVAIDRRKDFQIVENLRHGLKAEYYDKEHLFSVADLHEREEFPLVDFKANGIYLKLFENPNVFDSVFPGYFHETIKDSELWHRYFKQMFTSHIWSLELNTERPERPVFTSWLGNLEIFRKYGADLVVYGSSETSLDLVPALLRDNYSKILFLARPSMGVKIVGSSADFLAASAKKSKAVLWGYSVWSAYVRGGLYRAAEATQKSELSNFMTPTPPTPKPWHEWKLSSIAYNLSWNNFLPYTFQSIRDESVMIPGTDDVNALNQLPDEDGFVFSRKALSTPGALEHLASIATHRFNILDGISDKDCDFEDAEKELRATVSSLLKIADNLFIYVPPTTPLVTSLLPPCYLPKLKQMLSSVASSNVIVRTDDLAAYNLTLKDFAKELTNQKFLRLDVNHTNLGGAIKVTNEISRWMGKFKMENPR